MESSQTPENTTTKPANDRLPSIATTPGTEQQMSADTVARQIGELFDAARTKKSEINPTEPLERINPEDCKVIEPPKIFPSNQEAQVFFEDKISDDAEIIVLPHMMSGAELHTKTSLREVLSSYGNGKDPEGHDKSTYPVAVSLVDTGGKKRYVVLLSEAPNMQVEPLDEHRRYYRDSNTSSLPAIKENGFFQLPGRYCFRGAIEHTGQIPTNGRAIISIDIPNQYMITNDPTDLRAVAIGFNHPNLGAKLPIELQRELLLFDGRENQDHVISYKNQEQQVLPWGAAAGMLVRVDSSTMRIESTQPNQ